ncbi:prepilin-type N-terminal cleavage/methylation domain-containing protein [Thalassotalea piscium]
MSSQMSKVTKGFTLIELMISISILTLLLLTGSFVYSMLYSRWDKQLGSFSESARIAKNVEITQRVLEGVHPFVVVDRTKRPAFFFIGGEDSLLSVSYSGVFSGEFPEIFRITSVKNQNGKFDLLYQAKSVENFILLRTDQDISFDHQLTLFKDLDSVQFSYLGWQDYKVKSSRFTSGVKMIRSNRYSGIDSQIMPNKYSLTIVQSGKSLTIPVELDNQTERWLSPYLETEE